MAQVLDEMTDGYIEANVAVVRIQKTVEFYVRVKLEDGDEPYTEADILCEAGQAWSNMVNKVNSLNPATDLEMPWIEGIELEGITTDAEEVEDYE